MNKIVVYKNNIKRDRGEFNSPKLPVSIGKQSRVKIHTTITDLHCIQTKWLNKNVLYHTNFIRYKVT